MTPYEAFRRAIRDLNIQAQRDLLAVWRSSDGDPDALAAALAEVVQTYGGAAAALAADWYDELRADVGVRPGFRAVAPEPDDPGTLALIRWAAGEATNDGTFRSLVEGGVQKRITNYSRDVVMVSSVKDPQARGWMRIGNGACDFCAMLISRGAVYTKRSVNFGSHDHCNCVAAPAWSPDQVHEITREFVPSARRRSGQSKKVDADRARAWMAANL